MKSKLFLSLSLLTAVFSMQTTPLNTTVCRASAETALTVLPTSYLGRAAVFARSHASTAKVTACVLAPLAAITTGIYGLEKYMQKPEVKSLTYAQQAQQMIENGYNAVKANAVKGYELAKANPKTTGGIAAAVLAAGYLAYNSDLFGKSKAVVVAPVAKPVVISAKQRLNAF